MGNFQGYAIGRNWEVHNVYIKALGELGVVGAFALFLIIAWPLKQMCVNSKPTRLALFFFLLDVGIGLVHPEFLLTALSTCLIFWMVYAYLIESAQEFEL